MLTLKNNSTGENVEFKNSTDLVKFLKLQNPTNLKSYKAQFERLKPDLKIDGIGTAIRIVKIK